jgi:His/Glu/Gln/Arg/opine family amino acid ABC transporter permease subunit
MSCLQTISDYAFRSIGYGPRLLPKSDITLCEQVTLIGSGMLWNIYFGVLALAFGFVFATMLAVAKNTPNPWLRKPAEWFMFLFRGSPLFIQFFLAYELFVQLPKAGIDIFGLTLETGNLGLFGRNFLWCPALCPQGRYGRGGCIWHGRLDALSSDHLAHDVAPCMAVFHQRSYFPVSRHRFGVFLWVSGLATKRRCALLRVLFCREDVQPFCALSDCRRVFCRVDRDCDQYFQRDQHTAQSPPAQGTASQNTLQTPDHSVI